MEKNYSKEEKRSRRLLRLAQLIFDHWQEGSGMNTDLFQMPLIHDEFVIKGRSFKGGGYREHVVPRAYLRDKCLKLFGRGASVEDVRDILHKHLWVVEITKEEAEQINEKYKTTMPEGWSLDEGDPFARLQKSGIAFK